MTRMRPAKEGRIRQAAQRAAWSLCFCASWGSASLALGADVAIASPTPTPIELQQSVAPRWTLQVPSRQLLTYRGAVSWDEAGSGSGAMVYPAPDGVSFLAGVLTHALLVGSSRSREKDALQAKADEVLLPYRPVLDAYSPQELCERALARASVPGAVGIVEAETPPGTETRVSITPNFVIAQDHRSLVLDNAVWITSPGATPGSVTPVLIRVVSDAWPTSNAEEPAAYWSANEGARLKDVTSTLLAHSLDVALASRLPSTPDATERPFRTFRYTQGQTERMERGQLVQQSCGRAVIKTLRGTLLSVPWRGADAACAPSAMPTTPP